MDSVLKKLNALRFQFDLFQDIFVHAYKALLALAVLILAISFGFILTASGSISLPSVSKVKTVLPKNSFQKELEFYDPIGKGLLTLSYVAPKMHLPDLKTHLVYLLEMDVPDVRMESPLLHFSIDVAKKLSRQTQRKALLTVLLESIGKVYF